MAESKEKKVIARITDEEERLKSLNDIITKIEKQYGKGSIMKLTDNFVKSVDAIPTGCPGIDIALGIGGVPRGRIIEIYGPESSGKTTVTLHIIAEAQKLGGTAAFIDAEHALDPIYAKALGVNTAELYVSQPDTGEQALDICEKLVVSGALDVIVIDSVAALTPKVEIEGEMGQAHVGQQARLMSQALRKLTAIVNRTKTCVIFINQMREKIGVMFGNPETTPGGKALKFYSSVRIDIRRFDSAKEGGEVVGNKTRAKIVKNKLAPPFRIAEFEIIFGKGISKEGSLLDLGDTYNLIQKTGTWLNYGDEKLGQGRDNSKKYLIANPALAKELEEKIKQAAAAAPAPAVAKAKGAKPAKPGAAKEEDGDGESFEVVEEGETEN